jgi:phage shock protein PspC (stress-responsive transcriptional regulator)
VHAAGLGVGVVHTCHDRGSWRWAHQGATHDLDQGRFRVESGTVPDATAPPVADSGDMNENPTIAEPLGADAGDPGGASSTPPPPQYAAPAYTPPPLRPQLRRSRGDRVFGGVCGGIGRQYGIDPVLLRILLVVAAVFTGGAFLLVYVIAWALIPEEPLLGVAPAGVVATSAPVSYAAGGTGSFVDPSTGITYGVVPALVPVRREPRSYLGLISLSAAVLVGGLLALIAVSGVAIPAAAVSGAMLGVVGIGLVVGSVRGRARWLIAPAIVLLLVTQAAAVIPRALDGTAGAGVGDRTWKPTTAAVATYELGAGDATLDLRGIPAGTADLTAKVGIGQLTVLVPADTRVVLTGHVGLGDVTIPTEPDQSGTNLTVSHSIEASTPPAVTIVNLDAEIGVGQLEVRHASS